MSGGGGGSGNDLDSSINLAPFIDFLSALICFLLVSSVWVYIFKIETSQSLSNASSDQTSNEPPKEEWIVESWMKKDRAYLRVFSSLDAEKSLEEVDFDFNLEKGFSEQQVSDHIKAFRAQYPAIKNVVIHIDDEVRYEQIVQMMDTIKSTGLSAIGLAHDG